MGGKVIVTGGAGYVGSFICRDLRLKGFDPIVVDDFSTGFKENVRFGEYERCDLRNYMEVQRVFESINATAVVHAAGSVSVEESERDPSKYFRNNVTTTINILDACVNLGVKNVVFSSTAAVYDESNADIDEMSAIRPVSNYGVSKHLAEKILESYYRSFGLNVIIFRYFNASGANPGLMLGDLRANKTHLIPRVVENALSGITTIINGNDFNTSDGTTVRDYIHVEDIASAHSKAIEFLMDKSTFYDTFNLSTGVGTSVKEIIDVVGRRLCVSEASWFYRYGNRRPGDCQKLTSGSEKAKRALNWMPTKSLKDIIEDTIEYSKARGNFMKNAGQPSPYSSISPNQSAEWIAGYAAGHANAMSQMHALISKIIRDIEVSEISKQEIINKLTNAL
jgi:UDP-glucose 4-epimerase